MGCVSPRQAGAVAPKPRQVAVRSPARGWLGVRAPTARSAGSWRPPRPSAHDARRPAGSDRVGGSAGSEPRRLRARHRLRAGSASGSGAGSGPGRPARPRATVDIGGEPSGSRGGSSATAAAAWRTSKSMSPTLAPRAADGDQDRLVVGRDEEHRAGLTLDVDLGQVAAAEALRRRAPRGRAAPRSSPRPGPRPCRGAGPRPWGDRRRTRRRPPRARGPGRAGWSGLARGGPSGGRPGGRGGVSVGHGAPFAAPEHAPPPAPPHGRCFGGRSVLVEGWRQSPGRSGRAAGVRRGRPTQPNRPPAAPSGGNRSPVMSRTCSAAWWTRSSSPPTTRSAAAAHAAASRRRPGLVDHVHQDVPGGLRYRPRPERHRPHPERHGGHHEVRGQSRCGASSKVRCTAPAGPGRHRVSPAGSRRRRGAGRP